MHLRRSLCALFALLALGLAACGGADRTTQVATEGAPDPGVSSTTEAAPKPEPTTSIAETTAVPAADPTTTTTAAPASSTTTAPVGATDASPVAGLDAAELQAALVAPGRFGRSLGGPTVDQVTLADGTRVWRVRVPGDFTARSARVTIRVGTRTVGQGVIAPDLGSITAVTTDGSGLTAGKPVSYQWEGSPAVAVGTLAVAR